MFKARRKPLWIALLIVLPAALLVACGEPVVGGRGSLHSDPEGGPLHVVVEGTPYEMGWWQGRLLADRIRDLHPRWQAATFGAGEAGRTLRNACLVYADQTLRRLPEAARQELEGLAAGSGVPAETLLLTEVMGDGVRFHGEAPRLTGDLASRGAGPSGGPLAWLRSSSADARLLAAEGILLERRPAEGTATLLATWPGSLGGIAGASETGHGVVTVGSGVEVEAQSMGEVPFPLRLRRALERGRDAEDVLGRLAGGTSHRVLVASVRPPHVLLGQVARAATREAELTAISFFEVAADTPPEAVEVPERRGDPASLAAGWLVVADAFAGVRFEATRVGVVLGTRDASRKVYLPLLEAPE